MEFTPSQVRAANRGFAQAMTDPADAFANDEFFALEVMRYTHETQCVDMVKRNVWGTDIREIDTQGFTACCEHTHGGHYTNCPRNRTHFHASA